MRQDDRPQFIHALTKVLDGCRHCLVGHNLRLVGGLYDFGQVHENG